MKVRLIVDSTSEMNNEIHPQLTVLPLIIRFGEEEFIDGVTIDHKKFYEKLIECDTLPTTSQIAPHTFSEAIQKAVDAGEQVVVLTLSGKLSGTYQSAIIAASEFEKENVFVVDSKNVTVGLNILAQYALQQIDSGMAAGELAALLEKERENIHLLAMLDTLEYLKRGGRISKSAAFVGGMLSIKPVVTVTDGEVVILGKARGSKQANNFLTREIESAGGIDFTRPLMLGYSGLDDALLQKYITDSTQLWEGNIAHLPISPVGSIVGTHVGPGAVAVAFFKHN